MPSGPVEQFLSLWHEAVARKDLGVLAPRVADDVVLSSPALHRPKQGKAEVMALLGDVAASLEGYRVTRTWVDGPELLLEFEAQVGERSLQGVDRITLDAEGRLQHLKVFIRPYRGLVALMTAVVRRQVDRLAGPARLIARLRLWLRGVG
ncbi:MAG: nuclear transport factor 2 family protein [Anaeromyxobacter sp.]